MWFLWYLISICLSEVIVTAGIVLSCHACHIGKRSIAGGRSASFRRTDIAGLCVPLDSSIYFWHSWRWYTLLLDMPCINISLRISWFYRSNYFLRKSGSVICSMRPPHYGFHPPYVAVCECNEDSGLLWQQEGQGRTAGAVGNLWAWAGWRRLEILEWGKKIRMRSEPDEYLVLLVVLLIVL